MIKKTGYLILLIVGLLLVSCQDSETQYLNADRVATIAEKETDSLALKSGQEIAVEAKDEFIEYPDFWEQDLQLSIELLFPGQFHGGELPKNIDQKEWFGLFKLDSGGVALRKVIPKMEVAFDPIEDEGTEDSTGINIKMKDSERAIMAFYGIESLMPDTLDTPEGVPEELLVDESHQFSFAGKTYRLFATGKIDSANQSTGWSSINDYSLFLEEIESDSAVKTTLLVSRKFFDDSSIRILFIGDLDQDRQLDFLINVGHKYTAFEPTLYLSSMANENESVQIAGMGMFTGC